MPLTWRLRLHATVGDDVPLPGSDVTFDSGRTWTTFDTGTFDSVDCAADGTCWASGSGGRVAVLQLNR